MINRPNNWDSIKEPSGREQLPPGGYVVIINGAEVKRSPKGYEYLDLSIDIAEGEYKGYYQSDYYAQEGEKRWKGHYRQGTPKQDDEKRTSYFKGMIKAIEESNPGYQWNWDERSLVGRIVGCLFGEVENEYNSKRFMRTEPRFMCGADRIRTGDFNTPQPKMLPMQQTFSGGYGQPGQNAQAQQMPHGFEAINDDAIPF